MTLLIAYLLLALGVSFFCSIAEAVLLSVRPSYVAALEQKGKRGGKGRDRGEKKPAVPPALVRGPKPRQRKPEADVEAPVLEAAAVEEEGIADPPAGDVETPSEAMPTDDSDSSSA